MDREEDRAISQAHGLDFCVRSKNRFSAKLIVLAPNTDAATSSNSRLLLAVSLDCFEEEMPTLARDPKIDFVEKSSVAPRIPTQRPQTTLEHFPQPCQIVSRKECRLSRAIQKSILR